MANKKTNEKSIKDTYKKWYETVEILKDNADANNFMPLVAQGLELVIEIAKLYEKGYIQAVKNSK